MKGNGAYDYEPIGFVDDNPRKVGVRIHGVPVLGTRKALSAIVERHQPTEVLVAIPTAPAAVIAEIVRALEPYKIPIKTLPSLREITEGHGLINQIRSLKIEGFLLAREPSA